MVWHMYSSKYCYNKKKLINIKKKVVILASLNKSPSNIFTFHSICQMMFDFARECVHSPPRQGLSQDLRTGCSNLANVKILGVPSFKEEHSIPSIKS